MKKITASLLTLTLILGMCSCTAGNEAQESSAISSETSASSSASASESSSASTTEKAPEYVGSGYLKGLKIDKENCFVSENESFENLIKWAKNQAVTHNFKGSLIIATEDEVLLFAGPNGSKDIDGNPVGPYTTYEIGSITKIFTASIIMKLKEEGKIKLDDKLTKYFPEFKNGKDISVENLLSMTSGLPELTDESFWDGKIKDNLNDSIVSDEDFLECLYKSKPSFAPGERCEYCNTNYHVLAMIIEQIEGMSYGEVIKRDIFDPCGMEHSSAQTDGDVTSVSDPERGYHDFQNGARGAGDIHSCTADMVAFDRALAGGKIISLESLELMKKYSSPTQYGYGIMYYEDFAFGHSGSTPSYVSQNVIIETKDQGRIYFFGSTPTVVGIEGLNQAMYVTIDWGK